MLQAISHHHDAHHTRASRSSIETLTASLSDGKAHLLLACSGSVATIKLPNMIQALSKYPSSRLSIRVILTPSASRFLAGQSREQPTVTSLDSLPNVDAVDADEWKTPWVRGAGILHIELRRWADVLVIAPLSANTMAKIVGGFADSLLTSVVRAWDPWGEQDGGSASTTEQNTATLIPTPTSNRNTGAKKRHIIVAPAMNTAMWRHPITAKQIRVLEEEWGIPKPNTNNHQTSTSQNQPTDLRKDKDEEAKGWFEVLRPQSKLLACGDAGDGAMVEWTHIVGVIEERLGLGN